MIQAQDSVLVVEDDPALLAALIDTLHAAGISARGASSVPEAVPLAGAADIALVISDVHMPGPGDGHELLATIRRRRPELPVVLMTAHATVAQAVAAMREGATDYIVKPFDAQSLIEMARRQLATRIVPGDLVAVDPESRRLVHLARKIAETDATVLITGESGTGKEVYARFIRDNSARADKPFVAINCAAIPENMLEATLFGYEKGAFTGALTAHPGKFEQAQGGTLLLDEISEMDLGLQAKLLRVLGIATSNRDLPQEAAAGRFRSELFYRLNVMSVRLPALRDRRGDILPMARRAIQTCARSGAPLLRLAGDAEQKLLRHDWPGNARELTNIIQRAAWLATGAEITAASIDIGVAPMGPASPGAETTASNGMQPAVPADASLDGDLKERERELILATLAITAGSRKLAAQRLGISPRTLRHKLQQLKAAGFAIGEIRAAG